MGFTLLVIAALLCLTEFTYAERIRSYLTGHQSTKYYRKIIYSCCAITIRLVGRFGL